MTEYLLIGGAGNGEKLTIKFGVSILYRCPDTGKDYCYKLGSYSYLDRQFNVGTFDVTDSEIIAAIRKFAM